jgi:hypothetical protein
MCTSQIKPSSITGMQQKPPDFSLLFCGRKFFLNAQFLVLLPEFVASNQGFRFSLCGVFKIIL